MSPAQAILLFILATNTAISIAVFFTNPKRSQNRLFLIFSTSLSLWIIFVLGVINSSSSSTAQLCIRGASIAGTFIPVTFYLFCRSIASPKLSFFELCKKSKVILVLSVIVGVMCLTNFFLYDVTMPNASNELTVPEAKYGYGFFIFMSFFPVVIYRTVYIFYKTMQYSGGMEKIEMQFALLGMTTALPIALIIHIIALFTGSSQPQQYGPLCIIPMNLVIAYGIATKRILGIEKVLHEIISYALLASSLTVVYLCTHQATMYLLSEWLSDPKFVSQIGATVVALLILFPAQRHIHIATSKLIAPKSMDVAAVIKSASTTLQSVSTIESLVTNFTQLIIQETAAKSVIVLFDTASGYANVYDSINRQILLEQDSSIVSMLQRKRDTICIDGLDRTRETEMSKLLKRELTASNTEVAIGSFSKDLLKVIFLFGKKLNGRIYDKTEQDTLQIICNQFAVALENAQLYTEVQDSKIRNEIMLDQLVSGVILADIERKITLFNHEAQRITGINEHEAIGKMIDLLPNAIANALNEALSCEKGRRNIDARLFEQDDSKKSLSIRMGTTFLLGHDDKPMGALLVVTDMTELKSLEEQVRRTDQLSSVGTLAAGMAHEIKNPLVTIKTFTQLLPERYSDEDFREDFSSLVAQEVSRIDGIVNELLSFSKPTKPHLVPMNFHDTIDQVIKLTHEQMAQKSIKAEREFQAEADQIMGDAKLLSQAMVNLTLNAIEAIGSKGIITIGSSNRTYRFADTGTPGSATTKECIRIQISDTGQGIPHDSLKKIFDPFFTSKSEGTGMGLSVAHGIIIEHQGAIEVESETGTGTTFYIYIPLTEKVAA